MNKKQHEELAVVEIDSDLLLGFRNLIDETAEQSNEISEQAMELAFNKIGGGEIPPPPG